MRPTAVGERLEGITSFHLLRFSHSLLSCNEQKSPSVYRRVRDVRREETRMSARGQYPQTLGANIAFLVISDDSARVPR